jgi:hypothetical protein
MRHHFFWRLAHFAKYWDLMYSLILTHNGTVLSFGSGGDGRLGLGAQVFFFNSNYST